MDQLQAQGEVPTSKLQSLDLVLLPANNPQELRHQSKARRIRVMFCGDKQKKKLAASGALPPKPDRNLNAISSPVF